MRYDVDERHGVVVVVLSGSFGGGPDASKWYDLLDGLVRRGRLRVVADCRALASVDPAGLGALAGGLATMRNAGGDLAVACVPDVLRSLLLITRLTSAVPTYDTVDAAAKALGSAERRSGGLED